MIEATGAAIIIEDASAADTIRSIKQRVFAAYCKLPVHRQWIEYRPPARPRDIEPLADDETLGGAGVAQDGSANLHVLLIKLDPKVRVKWLSTRQSGCLKISISRSISVLFPLLRGQMLGVVIISMLGVIIIVALS